MPFLLSLKTGPGAQPAPDTRQSTAWYLEIVRKADIIIEVLVTTAQLLGVQRSGCVDAPVIAGLLETWVELPWWEGLGEGDGFITP